MYLYVEAKFVPSASPELRAAIEAAHVVNDVLPPVPDKTQIQPASNLRDPEKIAADIERRFQRAIADYADAELKLEAKREAARTAADKTWQDLRLRAETARAAVIIFARDTDAPRYIVVDTYGENGGYKTVGEAEALRLLFAAANEGVTLAPEQVLPNAATNFVSADGKTSGVVPIVVCHGAQSIVGMLRRRAVILDVPVPRWWPWAVEPREATRLQDTQWLWSAGAERIGLDRLARALGVPGRGDIDDAAVWNVIAGGSYGGMAGVVAYAHDEILRLRCCHRRLLGQKVLPVDLANLKRDFSGVTDAELIAAGYEVQPASTEGAKPPAASSAAQTVIEEQQRVSQ